MCKFLNIALGIVVALGALPAVSAAQNGGKSASASVAASAPTIVVNELIGLLPEADLVGAVDARRALTEVLPRLKSLSLGGIGKVAGEVELLTKLAGVDPAKIEAAVVGVKMTETLGRGSGVLLVQGVEVNVKELEPQVKAAGGELKTTDYKGKAIYTISRKAAPDAKAEELVFAVLGERRLAVGDLAAVQSVLDGAKGAKGAALAKVVQEAKAGSLVRFAGNLPEGLRQMLASQGELFAQVAAVNVIFGALDLTADGGAALDAKLRTGGNNDAAQLESNLKGLVTLGKAFLESNQDPQMQLYSKLIDQVRITTQATDVALSLTLSKPVMEQLLGAGEKK